MTTYLIPPPADAQERAEWEAGVAARKAAGLGTYVGDYEQVTNGPAAPAGTVFRYLDRAEIGGWFGISGDAVRKWQERYATGGGYRPFPRPDLVLGGSPGWSPEREQEIRTWHKDKPGRGAGGGRPRKRQPE